MHDAMKKHHLKHLWMIFEKIRETELKLKLFKCAFKRHFQHLGHLILGKGIYPLKEKVASLENLAPSDVTGTRHIIGLASHYRKSLQTSVISLDP